MHTSWRASPRAHPRSRGENVGTVDAHRSRQGSSPLTRGKHLLTRQGHVREGLIPAHAGKTLGGGLVDVHARAHPRSRGENSGSGTRERGGSGSSPLTRGKRTLWTATRSPVRLIPAHAGKTCDLTNGFCTLWAHPRSRGENDPSCTDSLTIWGSSPLTRGKPVT